jgi:hypothetical protein
MYIWNNSATAEQIFIKFNTEEFYEKLPCNINLHLDRPCFMMIPHKGLHTFPHNITTYLSEGKMFLTKVVEKNALFYVQYITPLNLTVFKIIKLTMASRTLSQL